MKEQFVTTCEPGLSVHLRDKGKMTVEELGAVADRYLETRKNLAMARKEQQTRDHGKPKANVKSCFKVGVELPSRPANPIRPQRSEVKCYLCSKPGHTAKDCKNRFKPGAPVNRESRSIPRNACWIEEDEDRGEERDARSSADQRNEETLLGFAAVIEGRRNLIIYDGSLGDTAVESYERHRMHRSCSTQKVIERQTNSQVRRKGIAC